MMLNAAAAAFYYLRSSVVMYMRDPSETAPPVQLSGLVSAGLVVSAILTVLIGVAPGLVIDVRTGGRTGAPLGSDSTDGTPRATRGPARSDAQGERLREYLRHLLADGQRLTVVSNCGPLSFSHRAGTLESVEGLRRPGHGTRGAGPDRAGDLGQHRHEPRRPARGHARWPRAARRRMSLTSSSGTQMPDQDLKLVLADVSDKAYELHYATVANPFLWFIQHRLYQLPYEPQVDDRLIHAWRDGYRVVNEALAKAAVASAAARRRAAGGAAAGLPRLPGRRGHPCRAARQPAAPLQPHPVAVAGLLGGAAASAPSCHLRGVAGERHRGAPDRPYATRTSWAPSMPSCVTRGWTRPAGTCAGTAGRSGCGRTPSRSTRTHSCGSPPALRSRPGARRSRSDSSVPAGRG